MSFVSKFSKFSKYVFLHLVSSNFANFAIFANVANARDRIPLLSAAATDNDNPAKSFVGPVECPVTFSASSLLDLKRKSLEVSLGSGLGLGFPNLGLPTWINPRTWVRSNSSTIWIHPEINGLSLEEVNKGANGVVWRFKISNSNLDSNLDGQQGANGQKDGPTTASSLHVLNAKNCSNVVLKVVRDGADKISGEIRAALDGPLRNKVGVLGFLKWQRFGNLGNSMYELQESSFLWMRKLDQNLREWMDSRPSFVDNGKNFVTIASQTSKGLLALQSKRRQLIHSDVKPANIMLKFEDSESSSNGGLSSQKKSITNASHVDWDYSIFISGFGSNDTTQPRGGTIDYMAPNPYPTNAYYARNSYYNVDDTYALGGLTFAELYLVAIDAEGNGNTTQSPGSFLIKKNIAHLKANLNKSTSPGVNAIGNLAFGILKMWDLDCFSDMRAAKLGKYLTFARINSHPSGPPAESELAESELRVWQSEASKTECGEMWAQSHRSLKLLGVGKNSDYSYLADEDSSASFVKGVSFVTTVTLLMAAVFMF